MFLFLSQMEHTELKKKKKDKQKVVTLQNSMSFLEEAALEEPGHGRCTSAMYSTYIQYNSK